MHGHRRGRELQSDCTSVSAGYDASGETDPRAPRGLLDRILAGPILNEILSRIRLAPGNLDRTDRQTIREINSHPLRMKEVVFSSESLCQVRIALPVSVKVAVRNAGIT